MKKFYLIVLRGAALFLIFLLGMISSIALLIVGGYHVADNVSLEGLRKYGINIETNQLFDDKADTPIRQLTILEFVAEFSEVKSLADTKSLDYLSQEYGLILPPTGDSHLFDAMRTLPLAQLFSQEGLDTAMTNIYVGDVLGYTKETDTSDPDNPVEYWYDSISNSKVSGVESMLADYTIYKLMYEGVVVSELVDSEPVGAFIGYTKNGDEWVDNKGDPVTGPMKFIADKMLSEVGNSLNEACLGDILGYEKDPETGVWMKDGVAMTGAMKAFADNKLDNIEDGMGEAEIGTILGYDKIDGVWMKDGAPLTGSMLAFADDDLNSLQDGIDNKLIGLMLGYEEVDGVWMNEGVPVTGAMKAIAGMTLKEVGDSENGISGTNIGVLLGYDNAGTEENPVWQKDGAPVTGIMKAMANKTFNSIGEIENELMGNLLGYTYISSADEVYDTAYATEYPDGYWINPSAEDPSAPCAPFVQFMSDATFDNFETMEDDIELKDLIPENERNDGYLKLIAPNTKLKDLGSVVNDTIKNATIGELVECGALEVSDPEALEARPDIRDSHLSDLLNLVLNPALP